MRIKECSRTSRWTRTNHYSNKTVISGVWTQCVPDLGCIGGNGVRGQFGLYGNGDHTCSGKVVNM